jgi:hypothetical protein
MTKPNIQDGDTVREMTDAEHANYLIITDDSKEVAAAAAQSAAKKSAEAKLAALGLTADEISAL